MSLASLIMRPGKELRQYLVPGIPLQILESSIQKENALRGVTWSGQELRSPTLSQGFPSITFFHLCFESLWLCYLQKCSFFFFLE